MAIRLTGTDTNGVDADANNDWWITLEGELVANTSRAFDFLNYSGITYAVHGAVMSSGSHGVHGVGDNSTVLISDTGTVQSSNTSILFSTANDVEVRNEGSVTASDLGDGIFIRGDRAEIHNTGLIRGHLTGAKIIGDDGHIINRGTMSSGNFGINLNGDDGLIENFGTVHGENTGVAIAGEGSKLFNAGEVSGVNQAIYLSSAPGEYSTVVNHGAMFSTDSDMAVNGSSGLDRIENEGTITGDISLAFGDDSYIAINGELDGEFAGGQGDDLAMLGDGALDQVFDYDGGDGSDTLDLSNFSHGIWADLTYAGVEVWTRDNNDWADDSTPWRRIADLNDVENFIGTAGIDLMRGDAADNTFGYVGDQLITGIETIGGRGGTDTVDFSRAEFAVWVDLEFAGAEAWTQDDADATDAVGAFREIADLADIENLVGTERVDALYGTAGDNLFSYRGTQAFTGVEIINGRGGTDTVDFSGFALAVWVDLAYPGAEAWTQDDFNATDTFGAFREIADLAGIENITGTDHADLIAADSGANVIEGGGGYDHIYGRGGADTFVYRDDFGRDTIFDFSADDAEKIDLSDVTEIIDFADLVTNHVVDIAGTAVIEVDAGSRIYLDGWTVADIGAGDPIDVDDFIF